MDRQCPSCGGFCKKSGCERENTKPKRDSSSWVDCTDEQLMEEVRRRGFVIRDAQIGREWVGLTDADKQEAFDETQEASGGFWEFADYLEAKLKEKNGG